MNNKKIAKIILSKVLEMPLIKYLNYIDKTTERVAGFFKSCTCQVFSPDRTSVAFATDKHPFVNNKKLYYAKIFIKNKNLNFEIYAQCLETIYSAPVRCFHLTGVYDKLTCLPDRYYNTGKEKTWQADLPDKLVCSLKWINTRNKFSKHILKGLLNFQKDYWFSGKKTDLKPLSFKQFLLLYPIQYLDKSRLSRLIQNLQVINPQNKLIALHSLFISKKKKLIFN